MGLKLKVTIDILAESDSELVCKGEITTILANSNKPLAVKMGNIVQAVADTIQRDTNAN